MGKTLSKAAPSRKHQTLDLDLGSLASVRKLAANVNEQVASGKIPPIRALILNAGYQDHTSLTMSDDGFEMTWQVNYLSNFLLVLLLLQSMDKTKGRILIVSSWSHDVDDPQNETGGNTPYKGYTSIWPGPEPLAKGEWETPQDDPSWYSGFRRYGASKLCAVMLQQELGHRLCRDPNLSNISVIGFDPGAMGSDLGRRGSFYVGTFLMKFMIPLMAPLQQRWQPNGPLRTTWKSGGDIVSALFDREIPKGGPCYLNGSEEKVPAKDARDEKKRRELWAYGVKAGKIQGSETVIHDWQ